MLGSRGPWSRLAPRRDGIGTGATHMEIFLYAKSKSGNGPHEVCFEVEGEALLLSCSCPAGEREQLCRHMTGFVLGDASMLDHPTAEQTQALAAAQTLLSKTSCQQDIRRILALEQAGAELKRLKQHIAEGLRDGFTMS